MRKQKLFLTAEVSRPQVEKFEVEIILQKCDINLKKRMSGAESEIVNDVFTILEDPSKSVQKLFESERLMKKETSAVRKGFRSSINMSLSANQ